MSWVFLTNRYAYKLKKPLHAAYLDFTTLAARRFNCEEEVRLNRRLAAEVYVGTLPLSIDGRGALHLGRSRQVVDWLVVMHRLPAEGFLDRAVGLRALNADDVRPVARILGSFYRSAEPVPAAAAVYREQVARRIEEDLHPLRDDALVGSTAIVASISDALHAFLQRRSRLFDQRVAEDRVVDGHGDLRPEHVFLGPYPAIIDCVEFCRAFRTLDPAEELAYLAMECERIGAPACVADTFFEEYHRLTGDRPPTSLIAFHMSQRACLRAKLAWWHVREPAPRSRQHWRDLARYYLRVAQRHAERLA